MTLCFLFFFWSKICYSRLVELSSLLLWNSIKCLIFTRNQEANTKKKGEKDEKRKNFQSFSYLSTNFLSLPFYNFSSLITLILLLPLLRLLFNRLITMNDIFLVFFSHIFFFLLIKVRSRMRGEMTIEWKIDMGSITVSMITQIKKDL